MTALFDPSLHNNLLGCGRLDITVARPQEGDKEKEYNVFH
jgi:hypothetical protein